MKYALAVLLMTLSLGMTACTTTVAVKPPKPGMVYVEGRWVYPPRAGAVWVKGHYERRGGVRVWVPGHWRY